MATKQLVATNPPSIKNNMCTVNFGGWGRMYVMTVENAMTLLGTFEHAQAYSQTYKDSKTIITIGGELPPVEVRLLSEEEYLLGLLNYEEGADK